MPELPKFALQELRSISGLRVNFLTKRPIKDTYGVIETPETSGLIPRRIRSSMPVQRHRPLLVPMQMQLGTRARHRAPALTRTRVRPRRPEERTSVVGKASRFAFLPSRIGTVRRCVQRSAFSVQRSAFSVQRSAFTVRRSPFAVRRSPFAVQRRFAGAGASL